MGNTVHSRASATGMASAVSRQLDCPELKLNPWPAKTRPGNAPVVRIPFFKLHNGFILPRRLPEVRAITRRGTTGNMVSDTDELELESRRRAMMMIVAAYVRLC